MVSPLFGRFARPKVTVGIPVYNSAEHVKIALDSVLAQTMEAKSIEVICVDDGSTDETRAVVEEYAQRFPRHGLRLLTQANTGGPATGRNRILEEARGHYLYYLDADDYFGPEALDAVYDLGMRQDADVVIGKFVGVGRGVPKYIFRSSTERTSMEKTSVVDSLNVLKAFRTEYVRRLPYRFDPALRMAEDHPFAMSAYIHTDNIAIQADVDCYYWVRHAAAKDRHLTGHVLPVDDFYAYFGAVFTLIRQSAVSSERARTAELQYWNRLLTFDIETEFKRARTPEDAQYSLETLRAIVKEYDALRLLPELKPPAALMLELVRRTDADLVRRYAALARR